MPITCNALKHHGFPTGVSNHLRRAWVMRTSAWIFTAADSRQALMSVPGVVEMCARLRLMWRGRYRLTIDIVFM